MQALILGIGDAFTRRSFGSSAVVRGPDGHVLVDCPDPIHRVLQEGACGSGWAVDATAIDDIVITHLHGDHCNGLESFGFLRAIARRSAPDTPRPRLHVTDAVAQRLWSRLAPAMDAPMGGDRPSTLEDYFEVHPLDPARPSRVAGLEIRCRFTGHPIPTVGLLISDGAATLGWSGDTPFEPAHIDWLSEADVIVHESNRGVAHADINDLNTLPDDLRHRIRLIHLPDDFDASCTDMVPLRQGEVLEVKRRNIEASRHRNGSG